MTSDDEEGAEGEGRPPAPIRNIRSATGKTRVAATTALVDPEATKKVLLAAQAAGFEGLGQFLDFVCDSGLLATPPKDGITATFSLEDLGMHLWNKMQANPVDRRAQWFHGLAPTQQTAICVVLRSRGFSTQNIAREFACEERVVRESWTRYADDLGAQVVGVRLTTIAGELQARAEHVTQLLMEGGKPEQAWKVQKEYTKLLQDLGVVDRAKREIHVTHSIDDQQKQELDKLLELKQKKLARQEEIKQIEVEVFDDVPQT
jgi:hypothetical protein